MCDEVKPQPMTLREWFRRLLAREPHFIIGNEADPYLLRWWLIPRNRVLNVYLHKFVRDDDDRAVHDHPWWSVSLMLRGGFVEVLNNGPLVATRVVKPWQFVLRRPEYRHRVMLWRRPIPGTGVTERVPALTLFITGPVVRKWGFWCPQGFVPWEKFTAPGAKGQVGKGCDQ